MKITAIEFNKILSKLKITTAPEEEYIRFFVDNNCFSLVGYYDFRSDKIFDVEFFMQYEESVLSDEQYNKIYALCRVKVIELEDRKRDDIQLLKDKELGYN